MSILVVEDDPMSRAVLARCLRWAGHTVLEAADGQAALELLRRQEIQPKLILLDLMLPMMTGWEVVALLALDPRFAAIPVAVLSAVSQVTNRVSAQNVVAVLPKPTPLDAVLTLAEHYDHPSQGATPSQGTSGY